MKNKHVRKLLVLAVAATFPLAATLAPIPETTQFGVAAAATVQAKEGWYKHIVDTAFVKEYAQIPPRKDVVIIDSRPAARRYDVGHIPGALNIPDTQFDKFKHLLPEDKAKLLIFYCGGLDCMLSHDSAKKAEALGYANIKVYAEGEPEWVKQGLPLSVSTAYVKKLLDDKEKVALIDARPKRVFDKGAIPGALNIPDTEFDKHVDKLPADKATPLIYYCGGLECVLSDKSAAKARALGYTSVKTYAEGYPAWEKAFPDPQKAMEIQPGKDKGTISAASFDKIFNEAPASALFVDVRDAKEYTAATIKGAISIPIGQLEKRIEELPKDKPVIFFCGTGGRAGEAYDTVKLIRPEVNAYFLDADMQFNADGSYKITKAR
ncbi:MAG: rhodanese-like domain-containing protein [Rhodocyclales bacterium]|nr:rhodanese-like domain-containing protein [Rhodocyclales bacterium]